MHQKYRIQNNVGMEKKDVVIRHKGRRFKRASVLSNGPVVALNPLQPSNSSSSQSKPLNRAGTIFKN